MSNDGGMMRKVARLLFGCRVGAEDARFLVNQGLCGWFLLEDDLVSSESSGERWFVPDSSRARALSDGEAAKASS